MCLRVKAAVLVFLVEVKTAPFSKGFTEAELLVFQFLSFMYASSLSSVYQTYILLLDLDGRHVLGTKTQKTVQFREHKKRFAH